MELIKTKIAYPANPNGPQVIILVPPQLEQEGAFRR
jgi:hypothetical protein